MKLKAPINVGAFIRTLGRCHGEVIMRTEKEDVLNLTSMLTRYIFICLTENPELLYSAHIECKDQEDRELLKDYLEE